ncbi:hypothetical protein [Botrimarina hoheduenensis]|uniref:Uncharacterized protein n=1 Tax=Botrimarina hoheduenensis TaxID=2528000 RepID=A0A5C5VXM5_9BACT|nr:hypothetical protein [Botrimarina hoheduenensis]TWT43398.1 hypothetical protein Pla111_23490 [Botrimarina hoheduenensis]
MGIRVDCPKGHHFKVKSKYAGKKGLCPYCESVVRVPALDSEESERAFRSTVADEVRARQISTDPSSSSVLDDDLPSNASTSGSLLGSSVIRHTSKCSCGQSVPMWFARCPGCGKYLDHR